MNIESAKKAKEFATIVRREATGAVIVKVPGHNGRFYFVRVTEQTVTCRYKGTNGSPKGCPSVGSGSVCYHSLCAYEKVHGDVHWCENEADATKLENLGKHKVEVRSTQDGRAVAWAVLEGKPPTQAEKDAVLLKVCRDYLALTEKVQGRRLLTPDEHERLQEARRQMGIRKMSHQAAVEFVAWHEGDTKKGLALLRGERDYAELI